MLLTVFEVSSVQWTCHGERIQFDCKESKDHEAARDFERADDEAMWFDLMPNSVVEVLYNFSDSEHAQACWISIPFFPVFKKK